MKRRKGLAVFVFMACIVGVCLLTVSAERYLDRRSWEAKQEVMFHQIVVRLDKLEEIYYQMGTTLEGYIASEERKADAARFQGLCAGAVCFVRNAPELSYTNDLFSGEEKARLDGIKELLSFLAKYEVDTIDLAALSEEELEHMKDLCFLLAECCNRGKEGTLAYCVNTNQVGNEMGRSAVNAVENVVSEYGDLLVK